MTWRKWLCLIGVAIIVVGFIMVYMKINSVAV